MSQYVSVLCQSDELQSQLYNMLYNIFSVKMSSDKSVTEAQKTLQNVQLHISTKSPNLT